MFLFFFFLLRLPPRSTLFPYTTLFRSGALTYTDIAGDPVLYGNLPPREISMKDVKAPDRKSGSAGMPRPNSYAVFCLKKKNKNIVSLFCRSHNIDNNHLFPCKSWNNDR